MSQHSDLISRADLVRFMEFGMSIQLDRVGDGPVAEAVRHILKHIQSMPSVSNEGRESKASEDAEIEDVIERSLRLLKARGIVPTQPVVIDHILGRLSDLEEDAGELRKLLTVNDDAFQNLEVTVLRRLDKQLGLIERLDENYERISAFAKDQADRNRRRWEKQRRINNFILDRLKLDETEIAELESILHPKHFVVGGKITAALTNANGENSMQLGITYTFDDNTSVVDATHILGSPVYAWTTTGSGTFDDATSATPVITQAATNPADDVVTCVVTGLAQADGGNSGSITLTLDLNDLPVVVNHFVTGGTITATA